MKRKILDNLFEYIGVTAQIPNWLEIHDSFDLVKVLKQNNINSLVISVKLHSKTELILPAIIFRNSSIYIIVSKDHEAIKLINLENNEPYVINYMNFQKQFGNEIILFEMNNFSGINNMAKNNIMFIYKTLNNAILCILLLLTVMFVINIIVSKADLIWFSILLLNVLGMVLAISYFLKENGINNFTYDFVCTANTKNSCFNTDIKSSFSLTRLAFIYFMSILIINTIQINQSIIFYEITLISVMLLSISVIAILYSIYLQYFKFRSVCRLCAIFCFAPK